MKFKEKTIELEHLLVAETLEVSLSQPASAANTTHQCGIMTEYDIVWKKKRPTELM